jgi:endonuclease YncB( thermonuclease family)
MQIYQPDTGQPVQSSEEEQPSRYLLAFKDHSIYSVVAYWIDGDTIHYFTSGNTHKQASVSALDRDLTERLNKESGSDFKLPPAK